MEQHPNTPRPFDGWARPAAAGLSGLAGGWEVFGDDKPESFTRSARRGSGCHNHERNKT